MKKEISNIQSIKKKNFIWTNVSACSQEQTDYLKEKYNFKSYHINDCLSPIQTPKLDITEKYIFMVLLFPVYDRKTRKIKSSEVDFFIGNDYLITVHQGELTPLINFFNSCKVDKRKQDKDYFKDLPSLLHQLLKRLFDHCIPILDIIKINISSIEENIFKGYEKKMVQEILITKTNIINFRKIMQAHQSVISKLIDQRKSTMFVPENEKLFLEILESTEEIWKNVENLKQNIESIENTNNSLISFQLSDIIKILTTISVVVLPITLITSIFSMNLRYSPLYNNPYAFWEILGIIIGIFIIIIYLFKRKKWL